MRINLFPFAILWGILVLVVACLALYRKLVSRQEDDYIHLDSAVAAHQAVVDRKLTSIDRWGKSLTVAAAVYGLLIGGAYLYQVWSSGPRY